MKVKHSQRPGRLASDPDPGDEQFPDKEASAVAMGVSLKLKRLLVGMDFSPGSYKALEYAFGFAEKFQASLIVLHVVEPQAHSDNYRVLPQATEEMNQIQVDAARERLQGLMKERPQPLPAVEFLVRLGHAHSEIPDTALAMGAELIILGTHGRSSAREVFLGSTAERVVRQAFCPVLTVPHSARLVAESH